MEFNGQDAGRDTYGAKEFMMIPLNDDQTITAMLCNGYESGIH